MKAIDEGEAQLPDFQRGWVWDDGRIRALISSVTSGFPVGAAMFLAYGNDNIRFKYRTVEGVEPRGVAPAELILDGQQRLTSLYAALYSQKPVQTRTDKGKEISRYYYIDIEKALDASADRLEAIISVPETKIVTSNFGRNIDLDVSAQEKEFEKKLFPLNIVLDYVKIQEWQNKYYAFYGYDQNIIQEFTEFNNRLVMPTMQYKMPVILLEKETPKEAVCQVFENVTTGGVSLTVFELVTAVFAMDDFELRKDWEKRKETHFAEDLTEGFVEAEKFLQEERIFVSRDLPYSTQLIPLAVLCALLAEDNRIRVTKIRDKIKQ